MVSQALLIHLFHETGGSWLLSSEHVCRHPQSSNVEWGMRRRFYSRRPASSCERSGSVAYASVQVFRLSMEAKKFPLLWLMALFLMEEVVNSAFYSFLESELYLPGVATEKSFNCSFYYKFIIFRLIKECWVLLPDFNSMLRSCSFMVYPENHQ